MAIPTCGTPLCPEIQGPSTHKNEDQALLIFTPRLVPGTYVLVRNKTRDRSRSTADKTPTLAHGRHFSALGIIKSVPDKGEGLGLVVIR